MASNDVEIRLFGQLRVRRGDGTDVDPREWSTGKTADLLRLLALSCGKSVPVETILDALWPHVDRAKGSASLRTAICQVRRVLREDCITRHYDGLTLAPAVVDVATFAQLAADCRKLAGQELWASVITVAREAEALYVGDLGAYDPSIAILDQQRSVLREIRLQVLIDAATAAVHLGRHADGIEFAGRAVTVDPFSERAYRALINSHAGAGEMHRAVAAFEQCRAALADELGIEPAPQTRALYLQLVKDSPTYVVHSGAATADASHRVALLTLISDVAATTGHDMEADEAYRAALKLARRYGLPIVARTSPGAGVARLAAAGSAQPFSIRDLVHELNRDLHVVRADVPVDPPCTRAAI